MLRNLRNGTFHYQPALISPKIVEFFKSPEAALWLYFIHEELCRWLRDHVDALERGLISEPEKQHWRQSFAELIGWVPLKPAEKELESLRELAAETAKIDAIDESEEAKSLRAAIADCDTAVVETTQRVRLYRRGLLAQLGLNPDLFPSYPTGHFSKCSHRFSNRLSFPIEIVVYVCHFRGAVLAVSSRLLAIKKRTGVLPLTEPTRT